MAKELPYFRFTVQEWQNGDITLLDYKVQGLFINICCYYWLSNCSLSLAKLKQRFRHDTELINQLIETGIIKYQDGIEEIEIIYLDEQWEMLSELRKKRQIAGKKGGKQKSSNAKAKSKQNSSYKDKDKDKDILAQKKRKPNPLWDCLCEIFKLEPKTKNELSLMGKLVRDLKLKEANPERVLKLYNEYLRKWPEIDCTPTALVKNYDLLKNSLLEKKKKVFVP